MNLAISKVAVGIGLSIGVLAVNSINQPSLAKPNQLLNYDYHSLELVKTFGDIPPTEDGRIFKRIVARAKSQNLSTTSMGEIVQQIAQEFLGAEYQAGLLDRSLQETLVISLQKFDCLLLVETVMAIANNIATDNDSYQAFSAKIENQRYWNGKMNGYCSRLHYFSDWLKDNQRRGNLINITKNLGGVYTPKQLNFMTNHRRSYPVLASSEANYQCIAAVEASLQGEALHYIPTAKIKNIYNQLQPGDIIGVATNIPGLDVTHTGFVYRQGNDRVGLLHASPVGKVAIAQDLQTYISRVERAIGIIVARPRANSKFIPPNTTD